MLPSFKYLDRLTIDIFCILSPDNIPCFRVVNSKGELAGEFAFGGKGAQAKLLEADGVEVVNGKVDLKKYGI